MEKVLKDYRPEEFGVNKDEINAQIMEQACNVATEKLTAAHPGVEVTAIDSNGDGEMTCYKEEFQDAFDQYYDTEYNRIAEEIGFDFCENDGVRKITLMNELQKNIDGKYQQFLSEHKTEPLYAHCQITYKDDGSELDVIIKLSSEVVEEEDDQIFYYCNGIENLKTLAEFGVEDFTLTECYHLSEHP